MAKQIICIVDDDPLFQYVTKRMIDKVLDDYSLLQFSDGIQAIEYIKGNLENTDQLPQLIFLDINMPELNGWQFLDEFRLLQSAHYLPVIYMASSSTDSNDINMSKTYEELVGYIVKPISREELISILTSTYIE
ncbi:response regulator [Dyadobacter flavalbus]|uniref:Response regulator n=1 Tax=Dyadobacter flavalbus TaxID=2579942 RepID=A0A5M8QXN0_9BACT|nr:response regulator [Dyadobacter flavalbus]KAA6439800.1 response regulator [Dyadobacter flavalbus]